jgi:hypothetical protein
LSEQVLLLSKKHGQLKQATTKMVQVVMGFLDDTPNLEAKLSVIETLRTVTEGKVSNANHLCEITVLTSHGRSSLKSRERESLGFFQTSRRNKATSMQPPRFCASFKSKHSVQ